MVKIHRNDGFLRLVSVLKTFGYLGPSGRAYMEFTSVLLMHWCHSPRARQPLVWWCFTRVHMHTANIHPIYIGWSDVTPVCDLYVLGQHTYFKKLSGEDLPRYSNKTESVGLRKCPHYHYLTKKDDATISNILQSLPHHIMPEKQLT